MWCGGCEAVTGSPGLLAHASGLPQGWARATTRERVKTVQDGRSLSLLPRSHQHIPSTTTSVTLSNLHPPSFTLGSVLLPPPFHPSSLNLRCSSLPSPSSPSRHQPTPTATSSATRKQVLTHHPPRARADSASTATDRSPRRQSRASTARTTASRTPPRLTARHSGSTSVHLALSHLLCSWTRGSLGASTALALRPPAYPALEADRVLAQRDALLSAAHPRTP